MKEFIIGGVTQARVVYALALRETRTRFGAHQLGYIWALLEPILWIVTFWGMFRLADRGAPMGLEVIPFLVTGVMTYELTAKVADRVSLSIDSNKALLFYPHVQPLDLILARGGLEFATSMTVFIIFMGGYSLATQSFVVDDILHVVFGLGLAGLFGISLGTVICSLAVYENATQRIKGPLMRPLFWVSGIFFTANALPSQIRDVLLWNPILHCVELVRDGWFPAYHAHHASPSYVMAWIIGLAFVGLTLERKVRVKVQLS